MSPYPTDPARWAHTVSWAPRHTRWSAQDTTPQVRGMRLAPQFEGPTHIDGRGRPIIQPGMATRGIPIRMFKVSSWSRMSDYRRVKALRELAEEYAGDPRLRFFVVNSVLRPAQAPERDYPAQAAALLRFVQQAIYYTNEDREQLQSPWWTLLVRTGDCDDMGLLLAAMAGSVALPWKFALAGVNRRGEKVRWIEGQPRPQGVRYTHIYLYLGWPPFQADTWAAAEPTLKVPLGHDVVDHGIPQGTMPELAGLAGTASSSPAPSWMSSALSEIRWDAVIAGIATGVLQGIVVTLGVQSILAARKKAGRKK